MINVDSYWLEVLGDECSILGFAGKHHGYKSNMGSCWMSVEVNHHWSDMGELKEIEDKLG